MTTTASSPLLRVVPGVLVVVGVCAGALGASGFHHPIATDQAATGASREPWSMALFVGGTVALLGGGLLVRQQRTGQGGAEASASAKRETVARIARIRDRVRDLEERAAGLSGAEVAAALQDLLEGDLFDLTAESDAFLQHVGFAQYAAIWDGVATGERLLARAWSMSIDGAPEEGRAELAHARAAFERAVEGGS